jgi:hypothetical protein
MQYLESFVAWDTFRGVRDDVFSVEFDHEWDARQARLAAQTVGDAQGRVAAACRTLAQGLAAVSRGSAAAARRLDAIAADELGRDLSPGK